jgi:hypothetical protein
MPKNRSALEADTTLPSRDERRLEPQGRAWFSIIVKWRLPHNAQLPREEIMKVFSEKGALPEIGRL